MAKKKKSALQEAASRRLARIGQPDPEEIAHAMFHAEQRGEVQRVQLDDGSLAWQFADNDGQQRLMRITPPMLAALSRFEHDHPEH